MGVKDMCIIHASLSSTKFVALSCYMWGTAPKMKLQKIDSEELAIPESLELLRGGVPRTIWEAILLVSALGERYLWVDSFCIVQDDREDVTENVESMTSIYGWAIFTLCAASGGHSDAGLPGYLLNSRRLVQHIEAVGDLELTVVRTVETQIQRSPWNSRSWTFQERLLTKRCLLFAEGRVFFQCRRAVWSEEMHAESEPGTWTLDFVGSLLSLLNENPLNRYCATVEFYTARHLTYQGDKLNAFAGIADDLQTPMDRHFLYGLPTSYFDWGLLWEPKNN